MLVVMREELGLVGGHVGVRGAVARAALAGEAPLEGLAHVVAAPAFGDELAAQHLLQQPRAAARGVALLARAAVARAHGAALRRAALAHADAALGSASEAVADFRAELHHRGGLEGPVLRAEA